MTIPRDFAAAMDLDVGDFVEIEPVDSRTLEIRKAQLAREVGRTRQSTPTSRAVVVEGCLCAYPPPFVPTSHSQGWKDGLRIEASPRNRESVAGRPPRMVRRTRVTPRRS